MVPPCSDRISRVPPYSSPCNFHSRTGLSPIIARLSRRFCLNHARHWPDPRSLATTSGVSVDVLSSGYLDVSVPRVRLCFLCIQKQIPLCRRVVIPSAGSLLQIELRNVGGGFPHSEIFGSKSVRNSPKLIAAYHVLHRLSAPRHPPNALKTLDRSHDRRPPGAIRRLSRTKSPILKVKTSLLRGSPCNGPVRSHLFRLFPRLRATALRGRTNRRFTMSDNTRIRRPTHKAEPKPRISHEIPSNDIDQSMMSGGARRDRTDDLMLAKHALSQLSYGPRLAGGSVETGRLDDWWAWEDLNLRPHAYQARALTN